jgi:dTDP-glucose 4,6-dehydratase
MNKILVTGGLGFIGSNLIKLLLKKKFKVVNIDKISYASNFYNTKDFYISNKYKFIKCDINNQKKVLNILNKLKPDGVINLAAETHVDRSIDSPKNFINSNIVGVFNILEAFRKFNYNHKISRLIHVSTDEVYGDVAKGRSKENAPYRPSSPYAASKIAADQIAISFFKSYNLPVTIIRPFNTFGPRQSIRAIIPNIILQAISKKRIVEVGNLFPTRDFTYVDDTVNGFVKALKNRDSNGQVINLGSGFEVSIKEIINILKKDFKLDFKIIKDEKRIRPARSEVIRLLACNKKAKNILNWKPQFIGISGFKKNLKKTLEWYKKNNYESYKPEIFNI